MLSQPCDTPGHCWNSTWVCWLLSEAETEGVEVVYEMVNARTDGTVKVGQFDLGGKVILKLKDGQLIAEFIKKETS